MARFLWQNPGSREAGSLDRAAAAPAARIDLWHAELTHAGWRDLIGCLSEEERLRVQAFAFERDARRYVVSHAILRALLGRSLGVAASAVAFRRGPDLKPLLDTPGCAPVHFSLSRSDELVLVGLAASPLGVDLERVIETLAVDEWQQSVLSSEERTALQQLDGPERRTAFFRCWTQKEALLKATGEGLRTPPDTVEIRLEAGGSRGFARIAGDPRAADRWRVMPIEPRTGFVGAVAAHAGHWDIRLAAADAASLGL